MLREIVHIDEDLCNGCGDCVPNCHEGALQIIDGKARLVSDLMCDGLGACLGHCPEGAITIEKREAEPYDEKKVMAIMVEKGENTVVAHLQHLLDHNETEFYREAIEYLTDHEDVLPFSLTVVNDRIGRDGVSAEGRPEATAGSLGAGLAAGGDEPLACGCPGIAAKSFQPSALAGSVTPVASVKNSQPATITGDVIPAANTTEAADALMDGGSQLSHWPVQMHLINPRASFFRGADVVLAADCVAYALGNFHQQYLKGKKLAIACPKLDHGPEVYIEKIRSMIDEEGINTLHIMVMEVPCCSGLRRMVELAQQQAKRKVPVKQTVVGVEGDILSEEWI
jgi:NAD-dependent dihydropyrimidine dehydrogenase PreA subunit